MSNYEQRFWKQNWDTHLDDLKPEEFETTYVEMIEETFKTYADQTAMGFLGVDISFRDLDRYANQFANMLIANGFEKSISLRSTPPAVTNSSLKRFCPTT